MAKRLTAEEMELSKMVWWVLMTSRRAGILDRPMITRVVESVLETLRLDVEIDGELAERRRA